MARDWEATFRGWTKPSSDTECEKQENAERMICDAIRQYEPLKTLDIKIIPQGSYRNNTNVKTQSDVDICVCCMLPFYEDYTFADYSRTETRNVDSALKYAEFKNHVHVALVKKFGQDGIHRGDKAFDVHPNGYRVDADVVATLAYRLYLKKTYEAAASIQHPKYGYFQPEGTKFYSDGGKEIINWPLQHYSHGVEKNVHTKSRFKYIVRALKNLQIEMEDRKVEGAKGIPSYLIECLIYNVDDPAFLGDSYVKIMHDCFAIIYQATETDVNSKHWLEVNRRKYLFSANQPWTRQQVREFILAAWIYGEFS